MLSESRWREIEYLVCEVERLEREIGYNVREVGDREALETVCRILRNMRRKTVEAADGGICGDGREA
jgi:hypothetical protein